jgi:acetyl esterase/lipase
MRRVLLPLLVLACTTAFAQMAPMGRPSSTSPPGVPTMQPQAPSQDAPDDTTNTGATDTDVVYGKVGHDKLRLDVYEPKGKHEAPQPAVLLIHGGAWIEGDKSGLAGMARWLQKNNYVVFNMDYRLFDGKHNAWPAQLDDAQMAVRWIRANAKKYNVDPAHIGAWGHSAGAQMAALLGEVDTRDNSDAELAGYSSRVQAVVAVACPADLTMDHDKDGDKFFGALLGGTFEQRPDLWRDASPVFRVGKSTSPFLLVHGTRDENVPIAQAEELAAALDKAGVPEELIKVDDGHMFVTEAAQHRLSGESVAFFNRRLR